MKNDVTISTKFVHLLRIAYLPELTQARIASYHLFRLASREYQMVHDSRKPCDSCTLEQFLHEVRANEPVSAGNCHAFFEPK